MAADIIFNAKTSRPSVCNAAESLLIHKDVAEKALKLIKKRLDEKNVELRGDKTSKEILPDIKEASEDDWGREYLDYIMSVKIVDNIDEAIEHIYKYGT
ncbi:MAG TPA: gamma-glutamyl-phosphate reductase, partial [Ruminococcaceae bacterium]|nr:gamma-glutamyl-phosphate reductase [Oscillospiraceae bacterium]